MDKDTSIKMLRKYFQMKKELISDPYNIDYLIIDCSPGAGFSTINVMVATDSSLFVIKISNADILGTSQMISALYQELKSRTLVIANLIPEDFIQNEMKTQETQQLVEKLFAKDIGNKHISFLGWIPQDYRVLNYEFEQALKTIQGEESSRIIFTADQPEHIFSQKIIELIPVLFDEQMENEISLEDKPEILIKQLKVIVLGEPLSGKTALYCAISSGRVPEKLEGTAGIDRYTLWEKLEENTLYGLNWWDFAGQDAYRDTWLNSIKEKAPNAKILPVLTHYDEVGEKVLGLTATEDWKKLEEYSSKYNTLSPIKVSNTEGTNIKNVELTIKHILYQLPTQMVSRFYLQVKEHILSLEENIFFTIDEMIENLELNFGKNPDYSTEKAIEIVKILSNQGVILLVEFPSSPFLVIFDIDHVTKAISLIIDQAKSFKGYIQEIDILDIIADFFPKTMRRKAVRILGNLMETINIAFPIQRNDTSQTPSSLWFIPHAAEIVSEDESQKRIIGDFINASRMIGKSLSGIILTLHTYDEMVSTHLLSQLLHYIPYSKYTQIWREMKNTNARSLLANIFLEEKPIIFFKSEQSTPGLIRLEIYIAEPAIEQGIFTSLIFALGKFKVSFEIEASSFTKTGKSSDKLQDFQKRLASLTKIPTVYRDTIQQAIKIAATAPSSTIVSAVAALEGLFVDLYTIKIGEPHPQMKFWEIIKGLHELNYVPRIVKIWADTVRLHRNNCAHNLNPIDSNDVMIVLEEVMAVLEWYNNSMNE